MAQANQFIDMVVDLTEEEAETIRTKAQSVGLDLGTYLKVRGLSSDELPEPVAFFALFRRLASFAKDYEGCLQSFAAQRPDAMKQIPGLAAEFAQLIQDWDDLYGPRPAENTPATSSDS